MPAPGGGRALPARLPFIDALKALASQLIVLHHLAFYGPMSEAGAQVAPRLVEWLSDHARVAVQAFFVIGGFLTARALAAAPGAPTLPGVLGAVGRRYRRLALPLLAAVALAVAAAALARGWSAHDSIPAAPTPLQLVSHALLLHDLLGQDALSAGVWYVAIDLQLFGLLLLVRWAGEQVRSPWLPAFVLAIASLFVFNLDARWDVWAVYFFGAYSLGVFAWQAQAPGRSPAAAIALALATLAALALEFRLRIAVALAVACLLVLAGRVGMLERWPRGRPVEVLGRISYSVFLVHFPVCLVVNAAFARFAGPAPLVNLAGMGLAWAASLAAGAAFHRWVENPLSGNRAQAARPAGSVEGTPGRPAPGAGAAGQTATPGAPFRS